MLYVLSHPPIWSSVDRNTRKSFILLLKQPGSLLSFCLHLIQVEVMETIFCDRWCGYGARAVLEVGREVISKKPHLKGIEPLKNISVIIFYLPFIHSHWKLKHFLVLFHECSELHWSVNNFFFFISFLGYSMHLCRQTPVLFLVSTSTCSWAWERTYLMYWRWHEPQNPKCIHIFTNWVHRCTDIGALINHKFSNHGCLLANGLQVTTHKSICS